MLDDPRFLELLIDNVKSWVNRLVVQIDDHGASALLESLWVLTNVASFESSYTNQVAESGVISLCLDILKQAHALPTSSRKQWDEIVAQAGWLLGNISGKLTEADHACRRYSHYCSQETA